MRILIDAAQGGGYRLHFEFGEDKRFTKPKRIMNLYDVLDSVFFLLVNLENDAGKRFEWTITPEALQKNRDRDIAFWKSLHDPDFRPYIPRVIHNSEDIDL